VNLNRVVMQVMLHSVRDYADRYLPSVLEENINVFMTRFPGYRREDELSTLEIVPFFRQGMHSHTLVFYAR